MVVHACVFVGYRHLDLQCLRCFLVYISGLVLLGECSILWLLLPSLSPRQVWPLWDLESQPSVMDCGFLVENGFGPQLNLLVKGSLIGSCFADQ